MSDPKTDFLIEQIHRLTGKKYELSILCPIIMDNDLTIIEPRTQYFIQGYYIDLYYIDLKLAIEIDEPHHNSQQEEDTERQTIIENGLNCEFYRIKTDDIINIYDTISELKKCIIGKIESLKEANSFVPWEPKVFEIEQIQKEYPNVILYKTNMGAIDDEHDPLRGPIIINQDCRNSADLFVTLSGDTVVNVYEINPDSWQEFKQQKRGFYQQGREIPNHALISSGTTKWNSTTNKQYGNNLLRNLGRKPR